MGLGFVLGRRAELFGGRRLSELPLTGGEGGVAQLVRVRGRVRGRVGVKVWSSAAARAGLRSWLGVGVGLG